MDAPICPDCQWRNCERQGMWGKKGYTRFRKICQSCRLKPYAKYKKKTCDFCGFEAVHPCQMDVDHIDGDHKNNIPDNLQTLCSNCHRLKTHVNKDILRTRGQL